MNHMVAAPHALPTMMQRDGGAMRGGAYSSTSWDGMPYPYPMPVIMIPEHAAMQTWMPQSPSVAGEGPVSPGSPGSLGTQRQLRKKASHPAVSQFSPAATDSKLAKKLERLQLVAQKRRKHQEQQQEQQQ